MLRKKTLLSICFVQVGNIDLLCEIDHFASTYSPGYKLNKCVSLLETFLQNHHLEELIWTQCQVAAPCKTTGGSTKSQAARIDPLTQQMWQELITVIVTLPDRVTSKMHKQSRY